MPFGVSGLTFVFLHSVANDWPYLENIQGWSERLLAPGKISVCFCRVQPEKNRLVKATTDGRAFKVSDLGCPVWYVSKKCPCDLGDTFFLPHML